MYGKRLIPEHERSSREVCRKLSHTPRVQTAMRTAVEQHQIVLTCRVSVLESDLSHDLPDLVGSDDNDYDEIQDVRQSFHAQ